MSLGQGESEREEGCGARIGDTLFDLLCRPPRRKETRNSADFAHESAKGDLRRPRVILNGVSQFHLCEDEFSFLARAERVDEQLERRLLREIMEGDVVAYALFQIQHEQRVRKVVLREFLAGDVGVVLSLSETLAVLFVSLPVRLFGSRGCST